MPNGPIPQSESRIDVLASGDIPKPLIPGAISRCPLLNSSTGCYGRSSDDELSRVTGGRPNLEAVLELARKEKESIQHG